MSTPPERGLFASHKPSALMAGCCSDRSSVQGCESGDAMLVRIASSVSQSCDSRVAPSAVKAVKQVGPLE